MDTGRIAALVKEHVPFAECTRADAHPPCVCIRLSTLPRGLLMLEADMRWRCYRCPVWTCTPQMLDAQCDQATWELQTRLGGEPVLRGLDRVACTLSAARNLPYTPIRRVVAREYIATAYSFSA